MKQENKNVTIFMGGGYEIAYIGSEVSQESIEIIKRLIKGDNHVH